jgi:hypothetical protein
MDLPQLHDEIARFPDLVNYLTRTEPLERRAKIFGQERSELAGGLDDLTERMVGLREVIDARDEHWTLDPALHGSSVVHTLRAKHPRAAEVSPISIKFNAMFEEGSPEHDSALRVFGYGAREQLTLNRDMISDFVFEGPSWLAPKADLEKLVILPDSLVPVSRRLEFVAFDNEDNEIGFHSLEVAASAGPQGIILSGGIYGQSIEIGLPLEGNHGGWITFALERPDCTVSEALGMTDLTAQCAHADHLIFNLEDLPIARIKTAEMSPEAMTGMRYTHELASDLDVVERGTLGGIHFTMTTELSLHDRIIIRNLRMMLEGKVVVDPLAGGINAELSGDDSTRAVDLLSQPGHVMVEFGDPSTVEILGRKLRLPSIRMFLEHSRLENEAEARAAIEAGKANGFTLKMKGATGEHVRMFMPSRLPSPDTPLVPSPWELEGVEQIGFQSPSKSHEDAGATMER